MILVIAKTVSVLSYIVNVSVKAKSVPQSVHVIIASTTIRKMKTEIEL